MIKLYKIRFLFAALLFCGACSTVQRAPVVDRAGDGHCYGGRC